MPSFAPRYDSDFLDLILVVCPACGGKARLSVEAQPSERRVVCPTCGHNRNVKPRDPGVTSYPPTDNICNGMALWYDVETRHGRFYAFNDDHLDYIAAYVAASQRQMASSPDGCKNASVTSRLPLWVKAAKNRKSVLKLIQGLKASGER